MSDILSIGGSIEVKAASGSPSGDFSPPAPLDEDMSLARYLITRVSLSADAPVSVPLGGLTGVNALMLRATGGKVRARVTSADGTTQAIPVDKLLVLTSESVDITAIDLTRVASTPTEVSVFVGQRAT